MSRNGSHRRRLDQVQDALDDVPPAEVFARRDAERQELCYIARFLNQFDDVVELAYDVEGGDAFTARAWELAEASGDEKLIEYMRRDAE